MSQPGAGPERHRSQRTHVAAQGVVDRGAVGAGAAGHAPGRAQALERRFGRLERRIDGVESTFERFDEWESCLSWLPVTEYGHADQDLGYLFDGADSDASSPTPDRYEASIDIDGSEWDDPDYELLAFLGRDRPFTRVECGHEPGEGVDRLVVPVARTVGLGSPPSARRGRAETFGDRLLDLRRDVGEAAEDAEDLLEPVQEFVQFDECMFTVGVQDRGSDSWGYRFRTRAGTLTHRSALSFDMRGLQLPQLDVMAFPGEEPPQIECNEDAGGENMDE